MRRRGVQEAVFQHVAAYSVGQGGLLVGMKFD